MNEPQRSFGESSSSDRAVHARRQFLRGQDLLQWWRDWGRAALRAPSPSVRFAAPDARSPAGKLPAGALDAGMLEAGTLEAGTQATWRPNGFYSQLSKRAMACQWEVFLNYGQYPQGLETALLALESLEAWESQLSVFRPDSEISRINRTAFAEPVPVSASLWDLLTAAENLWSLTEGAFDITSGSLAKCWEYLKREGRMPDPTQRAEALQSVGMDKVRLDPVERSVRFLHPGVRLDLGGIGKGWTLDRVADDLWAQGIHHFAFHGGQSSVVARGWDGQSIGANVAPTNGSTDADTAARGVRAADGGQPSGWGIRLTHPVYPDRGLGVLSLQDQALGTSGSARQFIHYRGQRLSHILDPRTGQPAAGVWSATVVAPWAAQADALGTACFVLGEDGCRRLVEVCPDLGILLVVPDGHRPRVVVLGTMDRYWAPAQT